MSGTGYLNRFIRLPFPDLGGEDANGNPYVWVMIRNPRLIPAQDLLGGMSVAVDDDGKPLDSAAANRETFAMMARLIIAGRVWDPTWLPELDASGEPVNPDEEAPLLDMPPTPEVAGKLPIEILNAIGEELKKINPSL